MTEEQRLEREDFEALLASGGWRRVVDFLTANVIGAEAIVKQVQASPMQAERVLGIAKGIRAALEYPQMRLAALADVDKREKTPDPFLHLRRVP